MKTISFIAVIFFLITANAQIALPGGAAPSPSTTQESNEVKTKPTPPQNLGITKILFKNGDMLSGKLIRATPELIGWKTPFAKSEIIFETNSVKTISFQDSKMNIENNVIHTITLVNQDTISGTLIYLDDKTLSLNTEHAGKIDIPRRFIRAISSSTGMPVIYKGPKEGDNWVKAEHSGGGFSISDEALILQRNCAAGIKIPTNDLISIEFEVSAGASFNIALFTNRMASFGGDGYMISMNQNYINIQSMSRRGGGRNIGNTQVEIPSKQFLKFTILANKKTSTFVLKIEDKMIQKWFDINAGTELGSNIVFMHTHGFQNTMMIKNIVISEWDGREEEEEIQSPEKQNSDMVFFTNKDKASGQIMDIKGDELNFKTDFATLKIPMDRLAKINFAPTEEVKGDKNISIVAIFANNNKISSETISFEDGILKISNPLFGDAKFKICHCFKLIFEPEEKEEETSVEKEGNPFNKKNIIQQLPIVVE